MRRTSREQLTTRRENSAGRTVVRRTSSHQLTARRENRPRDQEQHHGAALVLADVVSSCIVRYMTNTSHSVRLSVYAFRSVCLCLSLCLSVCLSVPFPLSVFPFPSVSPFPSVCAFPCPSLSLCLSVPFPLSVCAFPSV